MVNIILLFQQMFDWFERDRGKLSHLQHLCIVANSDLTSVESVLTWWLKGQLLLNPICISALLTTHKPNAVPMDSENTFSIPRFLHLFYDIYCQDNAELISVDKHFGQACSGQQRWMSNRMNGTRSKRRPERNPSIRAPSSSIFFLCLQCACIQVQKS